MDHGIICVETGYVRPGTACCYIMVDHGEAAVIETGTARSVPLVLAALERAGMNPAQVRYVIPTHVHLDHAGGAGALLQRFPEATLLVHPRGARHLIDPARLIDGARQVYGDLRFEEMYGEIIAAPSGRVREAQDASVWPLGKRTLLMRDTPGHARHHFCIWDEHSRGWFSGDTFGVAYRELNIAGKPFPIPTTTPVQFEPGALIASIGLLMSADPDFMYLTHFGRIAVDTTLADALREQIGDYVRLALAHGTTAQEQQRLQRALEDYTIDRLQRAGCDWDGARVREFLAMDMDLNAQGLISWRKKHDLA